MLLVRKVGIFGVLASSTMLSFDGMLFLDKSGRSDTRQRHVVMSRQTLMMIYPLYYISVPIP